MFSCRTSGTAGKEEIRKKSEENPEKYRKTQGNPLSDGMEGGWEGRMLVRIPARIFVLAWFLDLMDEGTVTAVRIRKIDGGRVRNWGKSGKNGMWGRILESIIGLFFVGIWEGVGIWEETVP